MKDKVSIYTERIEALIKERTGEDCKAWLSIQIDAAAKNMAVLDKLFEELMGAPFLLETVGSKEQTKLEASPLLNYYDRVQRTLVIQFESLGLNYRIAPKNVKEDARRISEGDPLAKMLMDAKANLNDPSNFMEP